MGALNFYRVQHARLLAGTALMAVSFACGSAQAQTGAVATDSQDEPAQMDTAQVATGASVGDIVVTGTRVKRDGYTAPTPETVLGAADIAAAAPANIADFVNDLPQLAGSSTPRTATVTLSSGSAGSNFLNLRGLGTNRTLILLDGRRVVGSNVDGRVDVNTLPSALISRVDVVTGGASAAYGSDAVSGVVNFVLDTKFTGLKIEGQSGITDYGDDFKYRFDAAGGLAFAGGRGHVIASISYAKTEGVSESGSRPWFDSAKVIPNPAYTATNGQPRLIRRSNVNLSRATLGGLITNGPLAGTQFGQGGSARTHVFGSNTGIYSIGGEANDMSAYYALDIPLEQTTAFGRASFDITDDITLFGEVNYGKAIATPDAPFNFHQGDLVLNRDNAFIASSTSLTAAQKAAVAAGPATFNLGTFNADLGRNSPTNKRELQRYTIGAEGKFGGSWSWNIYGTYGQTNVDTRVGNLEITQNFRNALDAVRNSSGQIVCRSTLTNPANGCVPFNPFGIGVNSDAAIDYVTGTAVLDLKLKQKVVAGTVQGEPFETWAGPVSVVVGGEYREESVGGTVDALSLTNSYIAANYKPTIGKYDVLEGFVETVVPLLRDSALGKSLDLNGAYRRTHYSISGSVDAWKLGATYQPIDDIRFRITRSRDIRAPNLNELFQGGVVQRAQTVNDRATATQPSNIVSTTTGNLDLVPELADTFSAGVVLTPRFLPGFSLSFDYYDIKVNRAITTLTNQQIADLCFFGNQALCGRITRDGSNVITSILRSPVNLATEKLKGFDIEGTYRTDMSNIIGSLGGRLTLRGLATYTDTRYIDDGLTRDEQAGENVGAIPKWRVNASVGYDSDTVGALFSARYVSPGVYDKAFTAADLAPEDNKISGATYYDLSLTLKFPASAGKGEFFVNVDNVFNKNPVNVAPLLQPFLYAPVNAQLYDTLGREFRVGARIRF